MISAHVEVGADRMPLLADQVRLVGLQPVQRIAILVRIHRDGLGPQLEGRSEGADGDLAAVGHQDLREQFGPLDAATPA